LAWDFNVLSDLPEGHGDLVYLGNDYFISKFHAKGGLTTLFVYEYRFDGRVDAPVIYRHNVEGRFAPTRFGCVLTYLFVESLETKEWVSWELISIELAEPQDIPEIGVSLPITGELSLEHGEEFSLEVKVSNPGGSFAIQNISLRLNGEEMMEKTVFLESGETATIPFKLSIEVEGTHILEIGGEEIKVNVAPSPSPMPSPTPSFSVSDLVIYPGSVYVGETVYISVDAINTGDLSGSKMISLKIDGAPYDFKTVNFNPGEKKNVVFEITTNKEGIFSVDIEGLQGSYQVEEPIEPDGEPSEFGLPYFVIPLIVVSIISIILVLGVLWVRK